MEYRIYIKDGASGSKKALIRAGNPLRIIDDVYLSDFPVRVIYSTASEGWGWHWSRFIAELYLEGLILNARYTTQPMDPFPIRIHPGTHRYGFYTIEA